MKRRLLINQRKIFDSISEYQVFTFIHLIFIDDLSIARRSVDAVRGSRKASRHDGFLPREGEILHSSESCVPDEWATPRTTPIHAQSVSSRSPEETKYKFCRYIPNLWSIWMPGVLPGEHYRIWTDVEAQVVTFCSSEGLFFNHKGQLMPKPLSKTAFLKWKVRERWKKYKSMVYIGCPKLGGMLFSEQGTMPSFQLLKWSFR